MKPSLLLTALSTLPLSTLVASSALAADIVACRATCVAVDSKSDYVLPLGYAKGSSEVNVEEAFDLMEMDCAKKSRAAGLGEHTMLVQEIEASREVSGSTAKSSQQSSSIERGAEGPFFLRLPARKNSTSRSDSSSSSYEQGFSYRAKPANYESCKPVQTNPQGRPKYQGDLNLLG